MKSKMFKKLMAAVLATTMTAGLAACGGTGEGGESTQASGSTDESQTSVEASKETSSAESTEETPAGPATVLVDENGNPYDLGGMEIIIRDWWTGEPAEPQNAYEEATQEYREWIQETYNFTIKQTAISDWGSTPADFVDYVTSGGDDQNYVFILREDPAITSAMANGLLYDLSTLDCLDFSEQKFQVNLLHKQFSKGGKTYAMYAGYSEPRTGVYFNKRLLDEAGINPEDIYDMQAAGTWTWDAFLNLCKKVQRDIDGDGTIDVYACNANNVNLTDIAVYSNGGEYVGQDASGKYIYRLEDQQTLDGLEFAATLFNNYWEVEPEGAVWDYYKQGFWNGEYAFMIEDAYAAARGNYLYKDSYLGTGMEDDFGFVMFPKGPGMEDYTNVWYNNPVAIPACYDADRAWKIAFAWNLYTNETPGYEDNEQWKTPYEGSMDTRAIDETLAMMRIKGLVTYHNVVPGLEIGPQFTWNIYPGSNIYDAVEEAAPLWKQYIKEVNDTISIFQDVPQNHWQSAAAGYALENGLMKGKGTDKKTGSVIFDPNTSMTRAEFAQVLYNMEGTPAVTFDGHFPDVEEGKWYSSAITWAYQNGIVTGTGDGIFNVNGKINRQEMATMLKKYAAFKGKDVTGRADLSTFRDADKIASWAVENLQWAVKSGIIKGKGDILDPTGKATRAECAAMLKNYCEKQGR